MSFLNNAWYCAGFSHDLEGDRMKSLRILDQPVVFFRTSEGTPVALADRCPHRFAPLSMGKLCDNQVECPYHGLKFDVHGQCIHNPHGDGRIPDRARVRSYPLMERYGALWIWMGESDSADPDLLPDFSEVEARPGWARVQGYLRVRANYQLVVDNLLDLSHAPYLHPFLSDQNEPLPDNFYPDIRMEQQGETMISIHELHNVPNSPLYKMLWERGEPPKYIHMRANMRWDIPSLLRLDTGGHPEGMPREEGPSSLQGHWLTPETETTTHYFWAATRDRYVDSEEVSAQMQAAIDSAFRNEDEPMVEACQNNMGTSDLFSLRPVGLSGDGPGMRARRILEKAIVGEQAG